jgi:Putative Ig domain
VLLQLIFWVTVVTEVALSLPLFPCNVQPRHGGILRRLPCLVGKFDSLFLGCNLGKFFLKTIVTSAAFLLIFHCLGCSTATQAASTEPTTPTTTPAITQVLPQTIAAGSPSTTLKVTGTNFPSQAAILWNGTAVATTVIDANTLSGTVGPSSLATPSTAQLQVQNTQTMVSSQSVPIVVSPASSTPTPTSLSISTTTIPQGVVGAAYTATLAAAGGTTPYTWSVSKGQLPAGLSLAASTGIISGTPTTVGSYTFTATVVDSSSTAQSASIAFTMSVVAPPATPSALVVSTTSLPSGTIGSAYSAALQVSGGTAPYSWSFVSGNIPAGLSLNTSTGLITGTPTASGTANFTASVADSESPAQTKSVTLSIVIAPVSLSITTSSLPSGTVGSQYSTVLQANGGTSPYSWSISAGSLPAGLSLAASTGIISGTPTAPVTANLTVVVADAGSPAQTKSVPLSLVIGPATLTITSSALASGTQNSTYTSTLQATGGTGAYTWSISTGSLPAGLTLAASTGTVSGKPTASGNFSFGVSVKDSGSPAQTATVPAVTLSIVAAGTPLAIGTTTLPGGVPNQTYSTTLNADGGTSPYTWTLTTGTLPAGLSFSGSTGVISGTPTGSGTSSLTFSVADSSTPTPQTKSVTLSLVVAPVALTITTSSLPGGTSGSSYSNLLTASGGTSPYSWSITTGSLPAGLTLTSSTGLISGTPTATGTSNFTVKVTDSGSPALTKTLKLSIVIAAPAVAPLTISTTSLAAGTKGTTYSTAMQAGGGTTPYAWSITTGSLPAGLSLASATGIISGTPTASGTTSFTATVTDSESPVQTKAVQLSIVIATAAPPTLAISATLPSGTVGTAYSNPMTASGGTPSYTWSITAGTLPAGLTLAPATGIISGTPTANGTSKFTATVTDNGSPAQTQSAATSIVVAAAQAPVGPGNTWFVRPDGGTRYSASMPTGQCDGLADVAYGGTGTDQHCAFNDFRYLWDDDSGLVGAGAWVIAGGDTVVVRGCSALPNQMNAANPTCRIGWDINTGGGPTNNWCADVGSYTCYNPPIPAGTATQHTRILGGCAYGTYSCTPVNTYPLPSNNLTQLFGGMGLTWTFNLGSTSYVDIEGIELTTHNGVCVTSGSPAYPRECSTSTPLDDYAQNGFLFNNTSANILLQDIYVHGFNAAGLYGPIGGAITATRLFTGFNNFAGWNFADDSDTPNGSGSSLTQSYVTMIGNGCYEQYPIANTQYPAQACYDTNSNGFGDSWSGQDSLMDSFTCDHCVIKYNTKDGFIGPHVEVSNYSITNSYWYGNMGSQWKLAQNTNSTMLAQNNLIVSNCYRMGETVPGAAQNFNQSTGLNGSYLTGYCRAGGNGLAMVTRNGSVNHFYGNTIIGGNNLIIEQNCGYYSVGNVFNQETNCGAVSIVFTNNNIFGYADPWNSSIAPGLYFVDPGTAINFTASYNNEYGLKSGTTDPCGTNNITCVDPAMTNEPAQTWPGTETDLDVFNPFVTGNSFYPTSGSPLKGAGTSVNGLTLDYYGVTRPNPPTIGAVQP